MGGECLRRHLRRPAPARRSGRRPARTAPRFDGRRRALHRRVAALRARLVAGGAHCSPCDPGRRRRDHDPDRPLAHLHDVSRGPRAEQGARGLGHDGRRRLYRGVADRRRARRRPRLGVGLLHQHPPRPGRARAVANAPAREPGHADAAELRPRRSADHHRRARHARLRDRRGAGRRLGRRPDDPPGRRFGDAPRCCRADRVAPPRSTRAAPRARSSGPTS